MKIQEIRVGNYISSYSIVFLREDEDSILSEWMVMCSDIEQMWGNMDRYFPIKLTEKWLIDLGATKLEQELFSIQTDNYEIQLTFKGDGYNIDIGGVVIAFVQFVHDWQNLYFDLSKTGIIYVPTRQEFMCKSIRQYYAKIQIISQGYSKEVAEGIVKKMVL